MNKPLKDVYVENENEKKHTYLERVLQLEKSTFTPIVFSSFVAQEKKLINIIRELQL